MIRSLYRWSRRPSPIEIRFWRFVDRTDSCWLWTGHLTHDGYGRATVDAIRGEIYAHRVAYELLVGPIPDGLTLDHLCPNRACVNPAHLEPVTLRENLLRGQGFAGRRSRQTSCVNGHPFDEANTHLRVNGTRQCRACGRIRAAQRRAA